MASGNGEPEPNATIYVKNLSEKIKIPKLVESLDEIFREFGDIRQIIAKRSLKMRGQAFVIYETAEDAQDALDTLEGFELFGRPLELAFARFKSDIQVKAEGGTEALRVHQEKRKADAERRKAEEAQNGGKRAADAATTDRPTKAARLAAPAGPDENLPPNKALIVSGMDKDVDQDSVEAVFRDYDGFMRLRLLPGRGLALVDFATEEQAIVAKETGTGKEVNGKVIKVSYQKRS